MEFSPTALEILCLSLRKINIFLTLNYRRGRFPGLGKKKKKVFVVDSAEVGRHQVRGTANKRWQEAGSLRAAFLSPPLSIFNPPPHPLLSSIPLSSFSFFSPPVYMCNRPHPNKATHESKLFEVCPRSHLRA